MAMATKLYETAVHLVVVILHTHPIVAGIKVFLHKLGDAHSSDCVFSSHVDKHLVLQVLKEVSHCAECLLEGVVIH